MSETLRVDQDSLRDSSVKMKEAANRLGHALQRALGDVSAQPLEGLEQPGAEFDVEYARLMSHAPEALGSAVQRLNGVADEVFKAARIHAEAAHATEELARSLWKE